MEEFEVPSRLSYVVAPRSHHIVFFILADGESNPILVAKVPRLPVRNVNVIVLCASAKVQGAMLHWFFALSATPFSGTLMPRSGTANVCDARSGLSTSSVLPSVVIVPPTVPRGWPQNGFRNPVAVSNW